MSGGRLNYYQFTIRVSHSGNWSDVGVVDSLHPSDVPIIYELTVEVSRSWDPHICSY